MSKVAVAINIQIGHTAKVLKQTTDQGFTHEWSVFVKGENDRNITEFVEKVVFTLHESFKKPKRIFKTPPFKITELGYGGFNLPVEIYFKSGTEEQRKTRLEYDLFLQEMNGKPINHIRRERITFFKPLDDFRRRLLASGGEIVDCEAGLTSPNRAAGSNSRGIRSWTIDVTVPSAASNGPSSSAGGGKKQRLPPAEPKKEVKKPDEFTALFGEAIIRAKQTKPVKPKAPAGPSPQNKVSDEKETSKDGKDSVKGHTSPKEKERSKSHKEKDRDKKSDKKSRDKDKHGSSKDSDKKSSDKEKSKSDKSSSSDKKDSKEHSKDERKSSKSDKDKKHDKDRHKKDKDESRKESKKEESKDHKESSEKKESKSSHSSSSKRKDESSSKSSHESSSSSRKDKKDKHKDKKKDKSRESSTQRDSDKEKYSDKEEKPKKEVKSSGSKQKSADGLLNSITKASPRITPSASLSGSSSHRQSPANSLHGKSPASRPTSPVKERNKRQLSKSPNKPSGRSSKVHSSSLSPAPKRSPAQYQIKGHRTPNLVTTQSPSPPATKTLLPPPAPVVKVAASPKVASPNAISPRQQPSPRNIPSPMLTSPHAESYSSKDKKSKVRPPVTPAPPPPPVSQVKPVKRKRSSSSSSNSSRSPSRSRSRSSSLSKSRSRSRSKSRSLSRSPSVSDSSSSDRSRSPSRSRSRSPSSNNRSRSRSASGSRSPSASRSPVRDSRSRSRSESSCSSVSPARESSGGNSPRPQPTHERPLSLLLKGLSSDSDDSDLDIPTTDIKRPKLEHKVDVKKEIKVRKEKSPVKRVTNLKQDTKVDIKKGKISMPDPSFTANIKRDVDSKKNVRKTNQSKEDSLFEDDDSDDDSDKDDDDSSNSEDYNDNMSDDDAGVNNDDGFNELVEREAAAYNLTDAERALFVKGAKYCKRISNENGEMIEEEHPFWFNNDSRVFYVKTICPAESKLSIIALIGANRLLSAKNYSALEGIQKILQQHNVALVNGRTVNWRKLDTVVLQKIEQFLDSVPNL